MEHKAEIVEVRQVSDGAAAMCARCCGDEMTDSWHTYYDLENAERHRRDLIARVQAQHQRMTDHLNQMSALGHKITKGNFVPGHCPHCGRGAKATPTVSR